MKTNSTLLTLLGIAAFLPASMFAAAVTFDNSAGTSLYETAANWSTDAVPVGANSITIGGTSNVTFSSADTFSTTGTTSDAGRIMIGGAGATAAALTINGGGTLNVQGDSFNNASYVGVTGGTGRLTIDNGTLQSTGTGAFHIGTNNANSNGTVIVNTNGNLLISGNLGMMLNLAGAAAGNSRLEVNGGTVTIGGIFYLGNSAGGTGVKNINLVVSSGSSFTAATTYIGGLSGKTAGSNITFKITDGTFTALNFGALQMIAGGTNALALDFSANTGGLIVGDELELIRYTSITGTLNFSDLNTELSSGDISYEILQDTTNNLYYAKITAIPEPSSYLFAGIGGALVIGLTTLRRRKAK